jgi:predicted metalloenzyme YecM
MTSAPDNIKKFTELSAHFLNKMNTYLQASNMRLANYWTADHICWRTSSTENYHASCSAILNYAHKITEADVNGRPISVFELFTPLIWGERLIHLVEIPAPKANKKIKDGFEHIEIVCDETFKHLEKMFSQCQWNKKGLEKNINPEIEIEFEDAAIKFHHHSLKSIIELENNKPVYNAILDLNIFSHINMYEPLIVGTFPLGIPTGESDVDILLNAEDFQAAHQTIHGLVNHHKDYSYKSNTYRNTKYLIYSFTHNRVPFEIYVQNKSTVKQYGFRHFFLEERILQLAKPDWRKKLVQLRADGLKTEPAFAQLLNLPGDPYESLLSLYDKNDLELSQLVNNGI